MKLRDDVNEFGTPITFFTCDTCGREYWVCPAVSDDKLDNWQNCLAEECDSYDMSRDVDALLFFGVIDGIERVDNA